MIASKGSIGATSSVIEILAIRQPTNRDVPTGGVIRPSASSEARLATVPW